MNNHKHRHEYRAIEESSAGYHGILLYCIHCGKAYAYNSRWELEPLNDDEE